MGVEGDPAALYVFDGDGQLLASDRFDVSEERLGAGEAVQFERLGYFCIDAKDSREGALVFNRIVTLRDSWAKLEKQAMAEVEQA